ncbi:TlpA family protein disulfide reductase [Oleiharenicola lentus]|uniref:TlpA family protein disulfide reductase n=1 Tax=Oleiharenicola lentus TaxID=2508720 RepID=UPI003F66EF0F
MNRLRLLGVALLACACVASVWSQSKNAAEKTPADIAADAFFKLRDEKDAVPSQARFAQIIKSGLGFLTQYPAEKRTSGVITGLATFGSTIKDKKLAPQRAAWLPLLKYEVINQGGSDKSEPARLAFAALSASIAGVEAKEMPNRATVEAFREKIDRLAELPGASRFLPEQERAFIQVLKQASPKNAEQHANALLKHSEKAVVQVARDELNLIEIAKQPLELKFTALDGKPVDVAQLRGKVVYLFFWATTNEASVKELAALKEIYFTYKKPGFEIISVSHDKEAAKDAVIKQMKDARLAVPVLLDGQGSKGELSQKLNVRSLPASALFDKNGMFVSTNVRATRLEAEVKKLLGIK